MANSIKEQINDIIHKRLQLIPEIEARKETVNKLRHELKILETAVINAVGNNKLDETVKDKLREIKFQSLYTELNRNIEELEVLNARFQRGTVNIGVSGVARVGKSTFLQTLSGLTEDQIPTGSGEPVTAVRSRIFNSKIHSRAVITFHSWDSLKKDIVQPFHALLGLPDPAFSESDFENYSYPDIKEIDPEQKSQEKVSYLSRLKLMQTSFKSYKDLLSGNEKVVDLNYLRDYVAYPKRDQIDSDNEKGILTERKYLAVKEAKIECSFPSTEVEKIGIIDLPGLGELDANAEKHHIQGLKNEVDFVILVKRPIEGMAFWKQEDGKTATLLDEARGVFIKNRKDFVSILVNSSNLDSSELLKALFASIHENANENVHEKHFKVIRGDARDKESVKSDILGPVLKHLAERLTVMDKQILDGTFQSFDKSKSLVQIVVNDLESAMKDIPLDTDTEELLIELCQKMQSKVAGAIQDLYSNLEDQISADRDNEPFQNEVDNIHDEVKEYIENYFGIGENAWKNKFNELFKVKQHTDFFGDEFNRIRVDIAQKYCQLDTFFQTIVEEIWARILTIFKENFNELIEVAFEENARESLERFISQLEIDGFKNFALSISNLLKFKLDFSTDIYPRVRINLKFLKQGQWENLGEIKRDSMNEDLDRVYKIMATEARQASYNLCKAIKEDAKFPTEVCLAGIEIFEDALIRSGLSDKEFRQIGRAYKTLIWPEEFQQIQKDAAIYKNIAIAVKTVASLVKE